MSDRIAIMNAGVLEQVGTPTEIYEKPASKFVATFIGETNLFEGYVKDIKDNEVSVELESGIVTGLGEGFHEKEMVAVSVRPERMKYSQEPVEGFTLEGMVKERVYVGSILKSIVTLPDGNEVKIERLAGETLPASGIVYLYWEQEDAKLIHSLDQVFYDAVENVKMG